LLAEGALRTSLQRETESTSSSGALPSTAAVRRLREEGAIVSEPELTEAISKLRIVLALETPTHLTDDHLLQLQAALEVADRAVRAERWAREGYEFRGI
jgi:hypothetical protein